jgi:sugar phosphate isomerase/epimerase
MGMPPASVDPERLRSLGAALAPLRDCAREGADEVLAHFPEVRDRETQAVLDAWVDQVADLLREVDATAADLAARLRVAALAPGHPGSTGSPSRAPELSDDATAGPFSPERFR